MTPTFFNTSERIQLLEAAAQAWIKTPWRENSCVQGEGGGVSCHHLVAAIYMATGAIPEDLPIPDGSARQLTTGPAQAILDYIDNQLADHFQVVGEGEDIEPGDLVVLAEDGVQKHVGIVVLGGFFVHTMARYGVRRSPIYDPTYENAVVAIRRPKE